jgi:hypothetical protein
MSLANLTERKFTKDKIIKYENLLTGRNRIIFINFITFYPDCYYEIEQNKDKLIINLTQQVSDDFSLTEQIIQPLNLTK